MVRLQLFHNSIARSMDQGTRRSRKVHATMELRDLIDRIRTIAKIGGYLADLRLFQGDDGRDASQHLRLVLGHGEHLVVRLGLHVQLPGDDIEAFCQSQHQFRTLIAIEILKNAELSEGDKLEFVADYYGTDGEFQDSYRISEEIAWTPDMQIGYIDMSELKSNLVATFLFTDIYNNEHWTSALDNVPYSE